MGYKKMSFNKKTILWHDYETFGTDPKLDRPSQFAGIRTDEDLNIIEEPLNFYCKPANDFLPNPMACHVTGVTPQDAYNKGVPEYEFIDRIHKEMSRSNTCNVGYNSIAFDDEVTRFTLYRNFFDPYAREWQNGCSRWDVMNMFRVVALTKPETLNWPRKEDGSISFRLEELSVANGIVHDNAHDALADVYATIGLAKIIKDKQPKLYNYLFNLRSKQEVSKVLKEQQMLVHIDSVYSGVKEFAAIVYPICIGNNHSKMNNNDVILVDLGREDFMDWIELPIDEIQSRLFSKKDELEEKGLKRPGFNKIAINKCPTIATYKVVPQDKLHALGINLETCQTNLNYIKQNPQISEKLSTLFVSEFPPVNDPDCSLYNGFIQKKDRSTLDYIRINQNFNIDLKFDDNKFHEMLFRYKARNFPSQLSDIELNRWEDYRLDRIKNGGSLTLNEFKEEVENMVKEFPESVTMAKNLIDYASSIGDNEIVKEMKKLENVVCLKKKIPKP